MKRFLLIFLISSIYPIESYKVLIVYPFSVKSLSILGNGLAKHLSKAGHEVTLVTPFPMKDKLENVRQIDVFKSIEKLYDESVFNITGVLEKEELFYMNKDGLHEYAHQTMEAVLENDGFSHLLRDLKENFDVVIADFFENEVLSGLSSVYGCPMIWFYSMTVQWTATRLADGLTNPAYSVDYMSTNIPPLGFQQRVQELWYQLHGLYLKLSKYLPKEEYLYKKVFEPLMNIRGKKLPSYEQSIHNVALLFVNDHHGSGYVPPISQNIKLIGGQHIDSPTKSLAKDLQMIMDNAKDGVIYFSMGSVWRSSHLPNKLIQELVKMFGELKQTVIWKYEANMSLNLPKNLHLVTWAPQQSILAHPNCLMFISHGGLLSSTEAIHFGVPVIGVPVLFDQIINADRAVNRGYAIKVDLTHDLAKDLKVAIQTMLTDKGYTTRAKKMSQIYHDRLVPLGKEVVHWVEHVVKYQGAVHLRSPAFHVPWYQKMYLDLVVLIIALLCIVIQVINKIRATSTVAPKKNKINIKKRK